MNKITKESFSLFFAPRRLAVIAILSAVSFVLYMFAKFPLPFLFPGFLDMQFSDLPALLGGFSLGPVAGGIIIVIKCVLKMPFSSTTCVGELADVIVGLANVIPAALFYKYFKSKKGAILAMLIGSCSAIVVSLFANRFILIPFYKNAYGMDAVIRMVKAIYPDINESNFYSYYLPLAVLPFNALRCLMCAVLTYFTYKPLSRALKWETSHQKEGKKEETIYKFEIKDYNKDVKYVTASAEETLAFAKEYAKTLRNGDVVLLSGDLGAGKTVFTKGVALGLGLNDDVTSPTYAYLNVYGDKLYHYDCYRLSCGEDASLLGLTDYFGGDNICIIEWAENIADVLPKEVKKVQIKKLSKTKREITIL